MNTRRKNRLYLVLAILIGLGLATALVMYALRANIDLFYTPGEIINGKGEAQEKPEPGQRLRVGGMVMPGSVKRDPQTLRVSFKLYDANGVISVSYEGILPDLFREGQGVVAQGVLEPGNLVNAREVLAKHDEKYTPPEIEDAMKKNHKRPADAYQQAQGGQS
ncbi:cytochrome c-type biogenesis protein CcmE [Erwinia toletana]|uniref:Cytochrome c-type biogenesis protein CcmE n=1 Tax=Winslowiella toletana TaxID=92490 RepID=A0ABS4P4Y6_9GAMM|nr:cytochrome c maturation protein CcmE [Winslowiella toletana]MBP2167708.1 cytochrome c-type biogenesis protein CcmE [Winslowiella toletana]